MAPIQTTVSELDRFTKSLKSQSLDVSVTHLVSLLKRRQIKGPEPCAIATAHMLRQVVAKSKWNDADDLLERVQKTGKRLVESQPRELTISNVTMRVLGLIRDEAEEDRNEGDDSMSEATSEATPSEQGGYFHSQHFESSRPQQPLQPLRPPALTSFSSFSVPKSLFHILSGNHQLASDSGSGMSTPIRVNQAKVHALRSEVIDGLEEIMDEISQVDEQVAASAEVQIQPGDYIMLHQPSRTVTKFILKAAAKRKFTVFLVGSRAPNKAAGQTDFKSFKEKLAGLGVTVTSVASSGVMAYMPRVDKVILGARAVLASGGVLVNAGAGAIARAAKAQGKAIVVLSGVYRLTPNSGLEAKDFVEWGGASSFVDFADGKVVRDLEVQTAVSEYVEPEIVDIYVTNLGVHSRDHLTGIIQDHYKGEDMDFHLWNAVGA